MKYSHIVFDIDGTLMDTESAILSSLQETMLEIKGIELNLDELKFALGIPGNYALLKLGIENIDEALLIWRNFFTMNLDKISIFNGVETVLLNLNSQSIRLGIVTSKTRKDYENEFAKYNLNHFFDTVICSDDTFKHKPNSEPIKKYLNITGASNKEVLYIGDSIYDMECAKGAEVDFALALWGRSSIDDIMANYYLNEPIEILNIEMRKDNSNSILIDLVIELQALSQAGLEYTKDNFDIERYHRIREISAKILSMKSGTPLKIVRDLFCNEKGFQTPKLDTRAAIFNNESILLVKEKPSGTWSLPGGWVDVTESIYSNIIKEVKEESGLNVIPQKIIAIHDRNKHNSPKYAYGICKIFILCNNIGGQFIPNLETTESQYFDKNKLPQLSLEKNTKEQILMCFSAKKDPTWQVVFD